MALPRLSPSELLEDYVVMGLEPHPCNYVDGNHACGMGAHWAAHGRRRSPIDWVMDKFGVSYEAGYAITFDPVMIFLKGDWGLVFLPLMVPFCLLCLVVAICVGCGGRYLLGAWDATRGAWLVSRKAPRERIYQAIQKRQEPVLSR